jgi:hypothetical protein
MMSWRIGFILGQVSTSIGAHTQFAEPLLDLTELTLNPSQRENGREDDCVTARPCVVCHRLAGVGGAAVEIWISESGAYIPESGGDLVCLPHEGGPPRRRILKSFSQALDF